MSPHRPAGRPIALLVAAALMGGTLPAAASEAPPPSRPRDRAAEAAARPAQEVDTARLDALSVRIAELMSGKRDPKVSPRGDLIIRVRAPERPTGTAATSTRSATASAASTSVARPAGAGAASRPAAARPSAAITDPQGRLAFDPVAMTLASARQASEALTGAPAAPLPGWSYAGETGPDQWAGLHPLFARCGVGNRQSPINIRGGIQVELEPIRFDYRPVNFSVLDTGHTVRVEPAPGNALSVMGRRYELVEFHFHRPAEERIDGRQFDMSLHMVHRDPEGRQAVVAVLLDRGTQPHDGIQRIWNSLPLDRHEALASPVPLDPADLLPATRGYYTYMGSRTTPPCDEGVLWMVMKEPVVLSVDQIAIFSRLYPMNARPLQALGGRLIKQSP
jgi:carbonic anhydrase